MNGYQVVPTGEQKSWNKVQEIMSSIRPPRAGNPRVLANDQIPILKSKNGGYPKHMYHPSMEPVVALREDQEEELSKLGYTETYVKREYPKTLFRRNMDQKFALRPDIATGVASVAEHVEERIVKDAEHEFRLRKEKAPRTILGDWVEKLDHVAPMPEEALEDPAVTIARLEGRLEAQERPAKK